MSEPGAIRIGDAERQAMVDLLRRHTSEGRLTLDEFSDLVGDVYAALTRDDLAAVVAKLPDGVRPATPGGTGPSGGTGASWSGRPELGSESSASGATEASWPGSGSPAGISAGGVDKRRRRRFVAIMSGSHARGPWRAPPKISAFAWWGHVHVDLRRALIESPVVEVTAWVAMGGITVTVPPGIPVELDGFVLMGGSDNAVRSQDPIPGAPLIRVRARGFWGGVTVRNPGQRRHPRDRHHHHGHGHGHGSDPFDQARRYADQAMDTARAAMERALPPRSTDGHIPAMPFTERAAASATTPPTPTAAAASDRPPRPAPPATPDPPASPASRPAGSSTSAAPSANGASPSRAATTGPASSDASADAAEASQGTAGRSERVPAGTLTMLVSDIVGSTQLAERLGDQAWMELLGTHNAAVRAKVAEHGGTEVKAQGDGFLVVFSSARAAVLAAIAIQGAMRDHNASHPEQPLQLRVGLHTGEVVVADDDVFGQNVVVACRIAEAAEPGEIVVSGLTHDLAASASDLGFDAGTDVTLKGLSHPRRIHRVRHPHP